MTDCLQDQQSTPLTCGVRTCRRGSVVVAVVALLAVAMALFAVWARAAVREQRQLRLRAYDVQAQRLAEAAVRRAAAQFRADPSYEGETWRIEATQLGGTNRATVRIRIEQQVERQLLIRATAEFPSNAFRPARHTAMAELNSVAELADEETDSNESGDKT